MFAVIKHNGNQYKVMPDKECRIDFISDTQEKTIKFTEVLLISDEKKSTIGTPTISGAEVDAEIIGTVRGEKLTGIKFRPKKRYKRNLGHKQDYTLVKILSIKQ